MSSLAPYILSTFAHLAVSQKLEAQSPISETMARHIDSASLVRIDRATEDDPLFDVERTTAQAFTAEELTKRRKRKEKAS